MKKYKEFEFEFMGEKVTDNNNLRGCNVIEVLEHLGVLEPTEIVVPCGFCTYKLYKVTEKLDEYCVERG